MTAPRVPLVVTMDLEVALDHDLGAQAEILERLRLDLERLRLPVTIFATAEAACEFRLQLDKLRAAGHEIGCHGRDHSPSDDFARMSEVEARRALVDATATIARSVGRRPRVFRGPWMTTSAITQQVLVELGYCGDFSPCPQRLDFFRTRGGSAAWLTAPRGLYHPSRTTPFRRGGSPLWVVPLSCAGAPFFSGVLYLAGEWAGHALFRLLLAEAQRTGRPIVYLFHSYEFCPPSRSQDRRLRLQRAYLADRHERYRRNLALLEAMVATPGVEAVGGESLLARAAG